MRLRRHVGRATRLHAAAGLGVLLVARVTAASAEPFVEARVVKVFDGDTIEVLVDGEPRRIRPARIDAPDAVG